MTKPLIKKHLQSRRSERKLVQEQASPWLGRGIPDLAYGTSARYSRFSLRDIGTLFPILPTGHRHEVYSPWGLMLPTSTRTPGVNYTSSVGVRYPPLNREVDRKWIVGTHSSGGLEGLVGGYQLVIWTKSSKEFMHARGADLSAVIEPLLHDVMDIYRGKSDVLVMCARNEDRDQLLIDSICRGHPQIKVQSVASSAGATATSSIVNQPFNGHLNGRPSDPFDQEECYARCTVAATRAQSLTVIVSQLDMAGMMGMMQVLAARARPRGYNVDTSEAGWDDAPRTVGCRSGLMEHLAGIPLVRAIPASVGFSL